MGRGMGRIVSMVVVALLWPLAVAAGPRHEVRQRDPAGLTSTDAWVQQDGGELRYGERTDVHPGGDRPRSEVLPPGPAEVLPGPAGTLVRLAEALLPDVPPDPYVPTVEAPDGAGPHLPDLVPMPAWLVYMDTTAAVTAIGDAALSAVDPQAAQPERRALRFGATIANRGRHSLEIVGVPEFQGPGQEPVRVRARQCTAFAGPRVAGGARACRQYEDVGTLGFHAQHGHFHIDGFARYRLLRDRGGMPDVGGVLARSEKVGFCMGDTTWLGSGHLVVDTGWYRECRHTTPHVPATLRQGISPQWGDSYGPDLPGQHLVAEGLPDGVYWIEITINPGVKGAKRIHEANYANNTSYQRIRIFKDGEYAQAF